MAAKDLQQIGKLLTKLSDSELEQVADMIQQLQHFRGGNSDENGDCQMELTENIPNGTSLRAKHVNAPGCIEAKIINGCGPYLYYRYYSGGIHRSVYVGKKS